jgi:hypothetical protein
MSSGMGGQSQFGGQGYGGQSGMGGGYGGQSGSPFGSNPMQTRPWMQRQSGFTTGTQYGQPRTGGQMAVQDSATPPTDTNPWGPGAHPDFWPRPYINPNGPNAGAPLNAGTPGMAKPAMAPNQPMTGGNDVFPGGSATFNEAVQQPRTGGTNYYQEPTFGQQAPSYMQQAQAPQAPPQSWEQQNSQLLRPQQMQDPAIAAQAFAGGPTLQSQYPGLNQQQLTRVNQIGANPVGASGALNDYLRSIGYYKPI